MTTTIPDLPVPPGAVRTYDWEPPAVTGYPNGSRYFGVPQSHSPA
jgi:hypothetical protein